jgi:hypothetical protein
MIHFLAKVEEVVHFLREVGVVLLFLLDWEVEEVVPFVFGPEWSYLALLAHSEQVGLSVWEVVLVKILKLHCLS